MCSQNWNYSKLNRVLAEETGQPTALTFLKIKVEKMFDLLNANFYGSLCV